MGLIPDDVIETVRLRSDIVEVVSRHVRLKKKGKNYIGLCPFHQERAPSFTVSPDKQIFHCFGCNNGGNVFKFLMLKENLTFVETVKLLAGQAGIILPVTDKPIDLEKQQRINSLRQINNLAKDFFFHILRTHKVAAKARAYLAGRGFTPEMLESFQIGYAPLGWDYLLKFMKRHNIPPSAVVEAGLAQKKEDGRSYDRFRGRVIFPIWDAVGRVIGFGGRVIDDTFPKYLNSPETPLFIKGHNIYGLHLAGKSAKEKGYIVIMEGYLDVITAHSLGITNAVASLGTSLTREQGKLLLNHSRDVIIAYDADAAGMAATMRSLELLQKIGCQIRVVNIPEGKDPDDFLQHHGVAAWNDLVDRSLPLVEYILQQAAGKKTISTISAKLSVMRQVFPYITRVKTDVEREESLKTVSRFINLSPEAIVAEFKRFNANPRKIKISTDNIVNYKHNILENQENNTGNPRERAEKGLLRLVSEDPYWGNEILKELGDVPFRNKSYNKIFYYILEESKKDSYQPAKLLSSLEDDEQVFLSKIITENIPFDNFAQGMKEYVALIRRCDRQERREILISKITEAERLGDHDLYRRLWREYVLLREITEAERTGNHELMEDLLSNYRILTNSDTWEHHREGSESAEKRS